MDLMTQSCLARSALLGSLLLLGACSSSTDLTVRVEVPGREGERVPAVHLQLQLLPYDVEETYKILEERNNPGLPPDPQAILERRGAYDSAYQQYREALAQVDSTREAAKAIKDKKSPAYREAMRNLGEAEKEKNQQFAAYNAIAEDYLRQEKEFLEAKAQWEEMAYQGLEALLDSLKSDRKVWMVETDSTGVGRRQLPRGRWWITGTLEKPGSAYEFYYWNVPLESRGGREEVFLDEGNAQVRTQFEGQP